MDPNRELPIPETASAQAITEHRVWPPGLRWFNWINVLCVFTVISTGIVMPLARDFGLSADGRYFLESTHVHAVYLFALNLAWRIYLGFFGGEYARWQTLLPRGPGYTQRFLIYVRRWLRGRPPVYLGHSPVVRPIGTLTLLALPAQSVVGLGLSHGGMYPPPYRENAAAAVAPTTETRCQ